MLDHVSLKVADFQTSLAFYKTILPALGIGMLYGDGESYAGFGIAPKAFFWINKSGLPGTGTHIAFPAESRAAVDAFYQAALAAGAKDNGPLWRFYFRPGRLQYRSRLPPPPDLNTKNPAFAGFSVTDQIS